MCIIDISKIKCHYLLATHEIRYYVSYVAYLLDLDYGRVVIDLSWTRLMSVHEVFLSLLSLFGQLHGRPVTRVHS